MITPKNQNKTKKLPSFHLPEIKFDKKNIYILWTTIRNALVYILCLMFAECLFDLLWIETM